MSQHGDDLTDDFVPDDTVALDDDDAAGSLVADNDDIGKLLSADEEDDDRPDEKKALMEKKRKRREKEKERKLKVSLFCRPPSLQPVIPSLLHPRYPRNESSQSPPRRPPSQLSPLPPWPTTSPSCRPSPSQKCPPSSSRTGRSPVRPPLSCARRGLLILTAQAESSIADTTAWMASRNLDDLVQFIVQGARAFPSPVQTRPRSRRTAAVYILRFTF